MKILQVCAVGFTYEKFLSSLCHSLVKRGHEVFLCFNPSFSSPEEIQSLPYQICPIPVQRKISIVNLLHTFFAFVLLLRRNKFDVVHTHTPLVSIPVRLASAVVGIPVVYTAHGFYFHENMSPITWYMHVSLEYILSKFTYLIFTQAEEDASLAKRLKFKTASCIKCIGNGVSSERFYPPSQALKNSQRSRLRLPSDRIIIGIVARKVVEKGYIDLFQACLDLLSNGHRFTLAMCGSTLSSDHSSSVQSEVDRLVREYPSAFIDFGEYNNVHDFYQAIDIFCLPSWREGMPRTIIEAMMTGLPIIASDIRGSRELVVNGVTGLLYNVGHTTDLAQSIKTLLQSPVTRQSMGSASFARASSLYQENDVIDRQISLLEATFGISSSSL